MSREKAIKIATGIVLGFVVGFVALLEFDRRGGGEIVIDSAPSRREIAVWVDGAVTTPGVYRLPEGARLGEAIDAAGGFRSNADLGALNLAARLSDEQHVVIPLAGQGVAAAASPAPGANAPPAAGTDGSHVDINSATAEDLDALPGIGPVLAERIVAYREANGPFTRVEELARVEGISPAMVDEMRGSIVAGP